MLETKVFQNFTFLITLQPLTQSNFIPLPSLYFTFRVQVVRDLSTLRDQLWKKPYKVEHNLDPAIAEMVYLIPDHVWSIVLPLLGKPFPAPKSSPPRSTLRQGCLSRAMRVCKLFASICEPLLYASILITDDLPCLLVEADKRIIHSRLGNIHHLRFEYSPKGDQGGYEMILSGGMWGVIGISDSEMREIVKQQCYDETLNLSSSMTKIRSSSPQGIFRSLKTIAVGSIYESDLQHWYHYEELREEARAKKAYFDCTNAVTDIVDILRLQHFCARDWMAPFCLPPMSITQYDMPNVSRCIRALHFNCQTVVLPLTVNATVRWIGDLDADLGKGSLTRLDRQFRKILLSREELRRDLNLKQLPVDIEIYLPSRVTSSGDTECWETFDASKSQVYEEAMRQASGYEDKVRFYTGVMENSCPACGLGDEV